MKKSNDRPWGITLEIIAAGLVADHESGGHQLSDLREGFTRTPESIDMLAEDWPAIHLAFEMIGEFDDVATVEAEHAPLIAAIKDLPESSMEPPSGWEQRVEDGINKGSTP